MTEKEKLMLIEECMDLEEGTLNPDDEVDDYEEWDSVTILSLIASVEEHFHKTLTGTELKGVKTFSDVLGLMG